MLRFLTNYVYLIEIGLYLNGQSPSQAFSREEEWLSDKIIANPKTCPCYSWEELKSKDIVGIYVECSPGEAVEILVDKIYVCKRLYNGPSFEDLDFYIEMDVHFICLAFGEIINDGHKLMIETDGGSFLVDKSPSTNEEKDGCLIFGEAVVPIFSIRSVDLVEDD